MTTTTVYGRTLGWIGNVIVDEEHRRKHIGRTLVEHAVTHLHRSRIKHIGLYCFKENVQFYEDLGFKRDVEFLRLVRRPQQTPPTLSVAPRKSLQLKELLRADKLAFGADRSKLIRIILASRAGWYLVASGRSRLSYILVKVYSDMYEIGPWICINPSYDEPRKLLTSALSRIAQRPVEVSCLKKHDGALELFERFGFRAVRGGYRMYYSERPRIGVDAASYALGFLDKG